MQLKKILLFLAISVCGITEIKALSCVTILPQNPSIADTITIQFNAACGNKGLLNFNGDVYMHAGLITATSASPNDWKYAVGNWGVVDKPAVMHRVGVNLYEKKIVLKDYFGVPASEEIKSVALVFRNASGDKVAKTAEEKDIFVKMDIKPLTINQVYLSNYISHEVKNGRLIIKSDTAIIVIQAYTNSIVKIAYFPKGKELVDTSYSVVLLPQEVAIKVDDFADYLSFTTPSLSVRISKKPLRISYFKATEQLAAPSFLSDENGFFIESAAKGFRFTLKENESIYGTGSRATALDKRGQKFSSYNTASYGYKIGAPTLNVNIPFIVSTELYGIYFENHSAGYFDIGASEKNVLQYKVEQGAISYYLISGNSFAEIMNDYTLLTGRQPLPPLWTLGFIQSKYGYKSDKESLKIIKKLQKEKFPIDGLVLDLFWFGSPKTMGNLDWDRKKFKQPELLIRKLDSMGVKLIPITEPFIAKTSTSYDYLNKNNLLTKNRFGESYIIENFWAGPSGLLDMYKPEARDWMWNKYKTQIDKGIAGWWCDLGEPESHPEGMMHVLGSARYMHNVYSQFWAAMLSEKYEQEYPDKRLFNLIRSGYAGMQRFSTFPWSGDIQRSYDGLKTQVQIMLGMGMSGVGYTHSDLGGFTGGPKNPELYTRWLQFGAFCPIMRAHGEGVHPEPVYYASQYKNIVRNYINLRYKLLPYNYTLSYENTSSGIPIARPINFYEPSNKALSNVCDEYFWGPNFLIAPVFEANASTRNVIFPSGDWINFWNDSIYKSHTTATVYAPLESMPIFVKAGSIIPMGRLFSTTKNYKSDSLFVYIYPQAGKWNSDFSMYEDDGTSANALARNQFEKLNFSASATAEHLTLKLIKSTQSYSNAPLQRCITYIVKLQQAAPRTITMASGELIEVSKDGILAKAMNAACYNQAEKALYVRCNYSGNAESVVTIAY